jgi:hypothetical protein
MTVVVVSIGLCTILFLLLVAVGIRSRMIFVNPSALSEAQIDAAVQITAKIMARTKAGSPAWTRAAAKHKAAVDEQLRRGGKGPMEDVELVEPGS